VKLGAMLPALAKRQSPRLLLISLAGWTLLLASDRQLMLSGLCLSPSSQPLSGGIEALLAFNSPPRLMLGWLAMMLAMMPPLLTQPLAHLWHRSLARRRSRAIATFAVGYGAVWLAAGIVLTAMAILLEPIMAATGVPALVAAAALAIVWQITPARQFCLNRCHRQARLSAVGIAADLDCLNYGIAVGLSCAGSCWAWMLMPLVAEGVQLPVMAAVTVMLMVERVAPARPARWGFAVPLVSMDAFPRLRLNRMEKAA
jgi:predicted metal-binding membrane protein